VWEGTCVVCRWNPTHYKEADLLITSWSLEWRAFNAHCWVEFTGRINYKWRLRNVKEIEGNNCGLVFMRWGRQQKALLEIIGLQLYLWAFRIRNKNSIWTRAVFRLPYASWAFFVTACRQPLWNMRRSRDLTWLVAKVRSVFYPPKYYLFATCLRPLHRHHERSSDGMVSYTLRQLSCRKETQIFNGQESEKALEQV
jgi:hypothetical protein